MNWKFVNLTAGEIPERKKYVIVYYRDDACQFNVDLGYLDFDKEYNKYKLVLDGKAETWYDIVNFIAWCDLPEPPVDEILD